MEKTTSLSTKEEQYDATSPAHYQQGGMQLLDIWKAKLSPEEFKGLCKGNVLKYVIRSDHKNGVEDLKKAKVYLEWLIEAEEKQNADSQHLPSNKPRFV